MLVSPAEGYRHWAATYDASLNPVVALEARHLPGWLGSGKRIIDVGCGTGRWLKLTRGVGIDLSAEMLAKNPVAGRIARADALRLPFADRSADVVLCSLSLGYMWPPRTAVEEMLRVARPGGTVIITDVHPDAIKKGWKHSFRNGSAVYEIENHPYALEDLPADGLEEIRELHFGEPERPIFEHAGKADYFEEACRIPAVWMLKWRVQ